MIYVPFPSLSDEQRLTGSTEIDLSRLSARPGEAIPAASRPTVERLRLRDLAGRPVYVLHHQGGRIEAIGADDGLPVLGVTSQQAETIAKGFSSQGVANVEGPIENDQWIVDNIYDAYRPFYRVHLDDTSKTILYISTRSGEVLQRTLGYERAWNYFGSIAHWIYPTVIRMHADFWRNLLWWLSLAGVVVVIAGLWLGITRMQAARRRGRTITLYRGWYRWHHILGLAAGLFLLTWMFSGWLSNDPGWLFSSPTPTQEASDRYRGMSVVAAANSFDLDDLKARSGAQEIEIDAVKGVPLLLTYSGEGARAFAPDAAGSVDYVELPRAQLVAAVQSAWPDYAITAVEEVGPEDKYGNVREAYAAIPAFALRIKLNDPSQTWVHVNASTGKIVSVLDHSRRIRRWLFNGLHSLDFPVLTNHRPLWDLVIVMLLSVGFVFSTTSAVIGMKRLSTINRTRKRRPTSP